MPTRRPDRQRPVSDTNLFISANIHPDRTLRVGAYVQLLEQAAIKDHVTDCADTKHNMYLSTALSVRARALISGDQRHLLSMTPYRDVDIITVRPFVDHFQTYS